MRRRDKKLSARFCERNALAVTEEDEGRVTVGYADKPDEETLSRIKRYFLPERMVEFKKISREELDVIIKRLYSAGGNYGKVTSEKKRENEEETAKAAPAVNLLNSIISEGILKGVSDIHIEIKKDRVKVRGRKDGKLFLMLEDERGRGEAVTARIKLLSGLNIMEHRRCQDGRFEYEYQNNSWDIRVSVIAGIEGESTDLRILGGSIKAPELEALGFTTTQLRKIRNLMKAGSGLVLAAGPTGSGKTTTLAAIISEIKSEELNIITVEDPVEYRIENVLQIGVDEGAGRSFAEVLRRILRHDPDILMVGEIRDEETAAMACRAALTGHLVFASIHTASCRETPLRLTDMGVEPYIVAAVLKGVISQRLIEKTGGGRTVKADIMIFDDAEKVRALCKR